MIEVTMNTVQEDEGYTFLLQDNGTGEKVQLHSDQTATDMLEVVARAMVALTFSPELVQRAMYDVAGGGSFKS